MRFYDHILKSHPHALQGLSATDCVASDADTAPDLRTPANPPARAFGHRQISVSTGFREDGNTPITQHFAPVPSKDAMLKYRDELAIAAIYNDWEIGGIVNDVLVKCQETLRPAITDAMRKYNVDDNF
ncbi:hypothetical protein Pmar_PMAR009265 [Perkinsus marinus ATCC 50983]|uniref:Uncharacterized protein n=1 Tax=Perkinsus marinus (strain ATCC 50983 / TXsc) TaxID=423536 RepID=C5KVF7_PERM5|nr:hypothetical protein Pmar_PMAR009265 [Perkinsus marinus ATCC 50983]EER11536.1 hypothetical protein Pmar_PMAR009265 [Perkinsus marinus ATCC 50983]|eukprot:XP_002779741.1 hypothetical protein Pmar_PMAR009265 [Perkinsus marinus ATCC 50983]